MQIGMLIRLPFAATFLYHGTGKLLTPAASAESLGIPLAVTLLVGVAEVLAGLGAALSGLEVFPRRELVARLSGLAAAPALVGAIVMVHWPRWSFTPSPSHPIGGMEFQLLLLGVALTLVLSGRSGDRGAGPGMGDRRPS